MIRLSRLLRELGYCGRNDAKTFLRKNKISLETEPSANLTPKSLVDPKQVLINNESVRHFGPMTIFVYKPAGIKTAYPLRVKSNIPNESVTTVFDKDKELHDADNKHWRQSEETKNENSIFKLLPLNFVRRFPAFNISLSLPTEVCGLEMLTQYANLPKFLTSVKNPLPRVYEVKVRDNFTGLEREALSLLRGEVKPSLRNVLKPPMFEVLDEKQRIARVTLYDYRPDKIHEMLLSLRHEPMEVIRVGLGNVLLETPVLRNNNSDTLFKDEEDNDEDENYTEKGEEDGMENRYTILKLKPGEWAQATEQHMHALFAQRRQYDQIRAQYSQQRKEKKIEDQIQKLIAMDKEEDNKQFAREVIEGTFKIAASPNFDKIFEGLDDSGQDDFMNDAEEEELDGKIDTGPFKGDKFRNNKQDELENEIEDDGELKLLDELDDAEREHKRATKKHVKSVSKSMEEKAKTMLKRGRK